MSGSTQENTVTSDEGMNEEPSTRPVEEQSETKT